MSRTLLSLNVISKKLLFISIFSVSLAIIIITTVCVLVFKSNTSGTLINTANSSDTTEGIHSTSTETYISTDISHTTSNNKSSDITISTSTEKIKSTETIKSSISTTSTEAYISTNATVVTDTSISTTAANSTDTNNTNTCEIFSALPSSPLLIYPGTTSLVYPEPGSNTTKFAFNQAVDFFCPGSEVNYTDIDQFGPLVGAVCKNEDTFEINGKLVQWRNISCSSSRAVVPTVLLQSKENFEVYDPIIQCLGFEQTVIGSIGFTVEPGRNLSFIQICFNSTSRIALYSFYNLTASINYGAKNVTNPQFRQDDIFYRWGRSVNDLYTNNQSTINSILGLNASSDLYINSNIIINRGHLAAKADFFFAPMQTSSYRYINAAPQWSTFNGGNWNQIEIGVRNYATNNKINLQVWTGTYGIAALPNSASNESENLYLYVDPSDTRYSPALPVPAIFWKLVYDPIKQEGIVLVGHNNPYVNITGADQRVCDKDVSNNITWLNWDKNNIQKGYCYACDYNDNKFQNAVYYLPNIIVKHLLV